MNETQTMKGAVIKTLAIVGFLVTVGGFVYLTVVGAQRAPKGFASLASIAESINLYRPEKELTVATEKIVVNSSDSFQISWTELRGKGEYTFSYGCVSGVRLEVRSADGSSVPMNCDQKLTLPDSAHGLSLTALSDDNRFTDIPLTVTFTNSKSNETLTHTTKITVVNAMIPVRETIASTDTPTAPTEEASTQVTEDSPVVSEKPATEVVVVPTETPAVPAVTKPVETGNADLGIKMVGGGVVANGVFSPATSFSNDARNAIRFDVKNTGTKTSTDWTFSVVFPTGEVFTSPVQKPLAPQAHLSQTLEFDLEGFVGEAVTISATIHESDEKSLGNNSASITQVVK